MITADPKSDLGRICREVDAMKPGQRLCISRFAFHRIPSVEHNGALFTQADRVLGNIAGSNYTHSYRIDPMSGDVIFSRYEDTGERRSTDPDHRNRGPVQP